MKYIAVLMVLFFISPVICGAQEKEKAEAVVAEVEARYMERGMIDGSAWRQFTDGEKGFYLLGFEDGAMGFAIHFIQDKPAKEKAYSVLPMSLEDHPPLSKIVKEVDAFYSDKKNIDIPIYYTLQIVRNRLLGVDEKSIQRYIQYLRDGANVNLEEILASEE